MTNSGAVCCRPHVRRAVAADSDSALSLSLSLSVCLMCSMCPKGRQTAELFVAHLASAEDHHQLMTRALSLHRGSPRALRVGLRSQHLHGSLHIPARSGQGKHHRADPEAHPHQLQLPCLPAQRTAEQRSTLPLRCFSRPSSNSEAVCCMTHVGQY